MTHDRNKPSIGELAGLISPADDPEAKPTPSGWFLGPNAENRDDLLHYAQMIVNAQADSRADYQPDDPQFIAVDAEARAANRAHLSGELQTVLTDLRNSIPLASYRNQSHMYWDITLPGAAGYFAGMLYNQNNVASEASPVTTGMEIQVGNDLCEMLGFDMSTDPAPWGHITCDGSVANAEAMWTARNLKYHGVAVAAAIEAEEVLAKAKALRVQTASGPKKLLDLSRWEQMNLTPDAVLGLEEGIGKITGLAPGEIHKAVDEHTPQMLGMVTFYRRYLADCPREPIMIAPATAHYSWPKGAAILGLGKGWVKLIPVDLDGRMDMVALRDVLEDCLATNTPVAQVVAVMGSTKESAVDPVADVLALRDEYAALGLTFMVHADAAWGGYFASMIRPGRKFVDPLDTYGFDKTPHMAMSPFVEKQFKALGGVDSITVDPHKAGFLPYPAGALCYRDERFPSLITHTAPVVFHGGDAPNVGVYGIEGSKPGAAAVGTFLSHRVIGCDADGYGMLLGRCIFNSKRYYAAMVAMADASAPYTLTPFKRLPAEVAGGTPVEVQRQIDLIRAEFVKYENHDLVGRLRKKPDLMALFRDLGPDLTVFAYAFNFRTGDGLNTDPVLMNELNDKLYNKMSLHINEHGDVPKREMFVTADEFDPKGYGRDTVGSFAARAGLEYAHDVPISYLISTMQNPWISQTAEGNFIPKLAEILDRIVRETVAEVVDRHGLPPFDPTTGA